MRPRWWLGVALAALAGLTWQSIDSPNPAPDAPETVSSVQGSTDDAPRAPARSVARSYGGAWAGGLPARDTSSRRRAAASAPAPRGVAGAAELPAPIAAPTAPSRGG